MISIYIPIIYISTAGIFDGKKDLYDDWDEPNPLGHYARSKYNGELYVEKNSNQYLILRAGWMMGGGPNKDKKFVNKIYKQIIEKKKILNVVNDKLGTPTYTVDFAKNAKLLYPRLIFFFNAFKRFIKRLLLKQVNSALIGLSI